MKKPFITFVLVAILFGAGSLASAGAVKVIKLKDGSTLKGRVIGLSSEVYTLETSNLGEVKINQSDILSITSENLVEKSTTTESSNKADLQKQVEQIQGTILSDEEVMTDIQNMLEDDNIKALLSDPKLMEDVKSFDQQKLEQNKTVQDLMNNPQMKNLMNKIQTKIPAQD